MPNLKKPYTLPNAGKEDADRQLQEKDTTGFIVQMQPRIQRLKNVHVRKDKKIIERHRATLIKT